MPEYLAPGVYVEETSFRAKSIEGVSTSTTAFVGAARTGPVTGTPELLTSFGDFERIYGGIDDLSFSGQDASPNYLAHAVRAYFDNGGSRLYVARAFTAGATSGRAWARVRQGGGDPREQVTVQARFPGTTGLGRCEFREVQARTSARAMRKARVGTAVLLTGGAPAGAQVTGGIAAPTFRVRDGDQILLTVSTIDRAETFRGSAGTLTAAAVIPANTNIANAAEGTLRVTLDGGDPQDVLVAPGAYTRAELVAAINAGLRGGFAALSGTRLIIGSDTRGTRSSVVVDANATFGFGAGDVAVAGTGNVGDLWAVTPAEIDALLQPLGVAVTTTAAGALVLRTVATGAGATLVVRAPGAGVATAHTALGLAEGPGTPGAGSNGEVVYLGEDGTWTGGIDPVGAANAIDARTPHALSLAVQFLDGDNNILAYDDLHYDRNHPRWIGHVLPQEPARRSDFLQNTYAVIVGDAVTADELRAALLIASRATAVAGEQERFGGFAIDQEGDDGVEPTEGAFRDALALLNRLEDISIVAAPGHSAYASFVAAQRALIDHVEQRRAYRIAILDGAPGSGITDIRGTRSSIDTHRAALYHPWVTVANPLWRPGLSNVDEEINVPPSGFIAGIYARNDVERGVWKSPANEVVRGALRFEDDINFAENEVLNPAGINCLRFFPGRGYRVWGSRTASSDPEWKYVSIRRYFNYLEASIERGTQWAVFEPNGQALWANVRDTISSFLYSEFRSGALLGNDPKEAYFVRCDRSTMTQNDLDNGRLVCLIGVAVVKPAEFVIFRIGQKTASARD